MTFRIPKKTANRMTMPAKNPKSKEESRAHAYHYRGRVYHWHKKDYAKAAVDLLKNRDIDVTGSDWSPVTVELLEGGE